MKKVGFIGIGVMGKPMARNLVKAGFPLTIYDLVEEPVKELVALGAAVAKSPRELGEKSEVIILMVPDVPDIEAALFGEEGALKGIREGSTIIVMSTIEFLAMGKIAEKVAQTKKGVNIIDAPVYRGEKAAIAGTLGILVGGDE